MNKSPSGWGRCCSPAAMRPGVACLHQRLLDPHAPRTRHSRHLSHERPRFLRHLPTPPAHPTPSPPKSDTAGSGRTRVLGRCQHPTSVAPLLRRCCTAVAPLLHLCCTPVAQLLQRCCTSCCTSVSLPRGTPSPVKHGRPPPQARAGTRTSLSSRRGHCSWSEEAAPSDAGPAPCSAAKSCPSPPCTSSKPVLLRHTCSTPPRSSPATSPATSRIVAAPSPVPVRSTCPRQASSYTRPAHSHPIRACSPRARACPGPRQAAQPALHQACPAAGAPWQGG